MTNRLLLALLALSFAAAPALRAQHAVSPGMRVRVIAPAADSGWVVGRVAAIDPAALLLRIPPPAPGELRLPRVEVRALEVSRGRPRATLVGVIAGGTLGALAGALLIEPPAPDESACLRRGCGGGMGFGFLVGGLAGAVIGGATGSRVPAGAERWEPVDPRGIWPDR